MTTESLTLTAFLLARIAKDEANLPSGFDCWYAPDRYAAECEAKRAIVALHEWVDSHTRCVVCDEPHPCRTLRALATVYADHPDHRDEWKP